MADDIAVDPAQRRAQRLAWVTVGLLVVTGATSVPLYITPVAYTIGAAMAAVAAFGIRKGARSSPFSSLVLVTVGSAVGVALLATLTHAFATRDFDRPSRIFIAVLWVSVGFGVASFVAAIWTAIAVNHMSPAVDRAAVAQAQASAQRRRDEAAAAIAQAEHQRRVAEIAAWEAAYRDVHGGVEPPAGFAPPNQVVYASRPGTNGTAVAALVAVFFLPPLALILGIVANSQIGRTGEAGRGMANFASVIGLFGTLGLGILLAVGLSSS